MHVTPSRHRPADANGLSDEQVADRLQKFGPNKIEQKERSAIIQFLLFMWNPLSWIMEIAAVVSIALSNGEGQPPDWQDFIGILFLLIINSVIGFVEKRRAGNAVKALMKSLAPECQAKRNGKWVTIDASQLVPGDIVSIKLGNIIPADARIISTPGGSIAVDQAALTGESLPVKKKVSDEVFSSTICKQGEAEAIIVGTGINTFFGRAAKIVGEAGDEAGHLQKILAKIGNFCICGIVIFIVAEILVMYAGFHYSYRRGINNILVLLIGGIPIAMPTVLSVTLALGAKELSDRKAIVTRITAIEELAAVTILCSDKTGTLTLNKLTIDIPTIVRYSTVSAEDIIRYAAYACAPQNHDAIDACVLSSFSEVNFIRDGIEVLSFIPFDPVNKRTEITYRQLSNSIIHRVTKGMSDTVLNLCTKDKTDEQVRKLKSDVERHAQRGFRSLAVALDDDGGSGYKLIGLLPIMDPPRKDTSETIKRAQELGVQVKMITGDQLAIAIETGRRLGMGTTMFVYNLLREDNLLSEYKTIDDVIVHADGFAGVYPEHKYEIVQRLQNLGHFVAMTGDGVNDAPALSKSNVGIAVSDACDAARAASAIVLTEPGLSVIIDAILGSRQIFQHRVQASQTPNKWNLFEIFTYAIVYGLYMSVSTLVFFAVIVKTDFFQRTFGLETFQQNDDGYNNPILHTIIYLQVSTVSQALIFITRSRGFFFSDRPAVILVCAFLITQICVTLIAVYADWDWTNIRGCGWTWAGIVWIWNIIWFFPFDLLKFGLQALFAKSTTVVNPFQWRRRRSIFPSPSFKVRPSTTTSGAETTILKRLSIVGATYYEPYTDMPSD
ncbi:unnamed protein product [Didymodactylos carnosus]|uniref:Plasma membrane ATPase n=1 Tax=Didymodactylos carnosus TaxID=1234261 RepID=A0A8S2DGB5_9BILA|nr:unnamed protein product [Didymodactylos carnosus]CAF3732715.1 unnamed protein product [Didymodactylos carnosus]